MIFRLVSDLHLEFADFLLPKMLNDSNTVLLLAGDIGEIEEKNKIDRFFKEYSSKFFHICYVVGNHEFYRGYLEDSVKKLKDIASNYQNISILDNEVKTLGKISIIGSTLWTDYDNASKTAMDDAERGISDYRYILISKDNPLPIYSSHLLRKHEESVKFLINAIESEHNKGNSTVVLTHHSPSYNSISTRFLGSHINPAFSSNLDDIITMYKPYVWCHGHTHDSFVYRISNTMVYCNPRGYKGYEYNGIFNSKYSFEVV